MSVFDPPVYLEAERGHWIGEGRCWEITLVRNGNRTKIYGLNERDKDQILGLFSVLEIYVREPTLGQVEKPRWLR